MKVTGPIETENKKELLWADIQKQSKQTEMAMSQLERKRTGSYYTDFRLTDAMIEELVQKIIADKKDIETLSFLEPCAGAGNFVFSYLKKIASLNLSKRKIKTLLSNLYVCDINKNALKTYSKNLTLFAKIYFDIDLDESYFDSHIGKGLLVNVQDKELSYIPLEKCFPNLKKKFDVVVTNPPYKNLKAEQDQYTNKADFEEDKKKYFDLYETIKHNFSYSLDGILNLYKLFVEAIVDQYAKKNAYISLLIPLTILSDKTSEKLRTHLLAQKNIISVKVIGENSGFIDAQQALSAILLENKKGTKTIKLCKNYCVNPNQETVINIKDIMNEGTGNSIFAINESEYNTLKHLRKFPTVKDLPFISNLRGELDLTLYRDFITTEKTDYKLLRGRNIGEYFISDSDEFVKNDFIKKTNKKDFIKNERIICQQIVNINKKKRVNFSYIPQGFVLGNSCNFISVAKNEYGIDIFTLLGLFNSSIINWYFKLTSSNNHINNYEIATFPIPVDSPNLKKISDKVKELLKTKNKTLIEEIEKLSYEAYNANYREEKMNENTSELVKRFAEDIKYIIPTFDENSASSIINGNLEMPSYLLQNGITLDGMNKNAVLGIAEKYIKISKHEILNHTTFKLSDLDLEMIKAVPQGGSWKDIPKETVEKSKRLKQITQTGGRTTLYGRIDYSKPSYTITTYFNRPGNGTYVHPTQERVISVREAARFQTFKDDYYFFGNKTQLLKQVGNAVPTLFAYQLAKSIVEKTGCTKSVDLFCGAGGMTAGFKEAGVKSIICNDIEEAACTTLKINNPEMNVLCGDVTKREVKEKIIERAKKYGADIICGGPPCQGFSLAGFRDEHDPRNQLFRDFVEIVGEVKPKIIVFENVEGLLSYQGGKVYQDILALFTELGYWAEGKTIMTNEYAVPQKRKRVIIICTKKELNISPDYLFPKAITTNPDYQVSAKDTIFEFDRIEPSEHAVYNISEEFDIVKVFKEKISYADFVETHTEPEQAVKMDIGELFDDVPYKVAFKF